MLGKNRKIILSATQRLLKPIAALCVTRGIKIREVIELVKRAFVEAAEDDLRKRALNATTSKISAMTGLQRKDIIRLETAPEEPQVFDLVTRIVGQWTYDARFITDSGKPKKLFLEGKEGNFWDLVKSVSSDLNAYTVLFELERADVAERDDGGWIKLKRAVPSFDGDIVQGLQVLSEDQSTLIRSVTENIFERGEIPNHHIRTYFDNLCPEDEAKIRQWFIDRGAAWHQEAREYLSAFDKDINPDLAEQQGGMRAVFGSFSLKEPKVGSADAELVPAKQRRRKK